MLISEKVTKLIETKGLTAIEVARSVGVDKSTISRLSNNKNTITFETVMNLCWTFFEESINEIIWDYSKSARTVNLRKCLEFFTSSLMDREALGIHTRLKMSKNSADIEWTESYSLLIDLLVNKINPSIIIKKSNEMSTRKTEPELLIFHRILIIYCYYLQKKYNVICEIIDDLEQDINTLKDEFIKKSYLRRYCSIMSIVYLHYGQAEKARELADRVIKSDHRNVFLASSYQTVGNSYLYENPELAVVNIKLAIDLYTNEEHRQVAMQTLTFIQNYWEMEPTFLDQLDSSTESLNEHAFYLIRKGMNSKALEILDEHDKSNFNNSQLGYFYYLKGLATGEEKYFFKSVVHYKTTGDKFYRKLALLELQKLGTNEYELEALSI